MAAQDSGEQARVKGMLDSLQSQDASIESILAYSKFVVAYFLQQDGQNPGWRKANIEGPVYLVRRNTSPEFRLLVKNQFSSQDLLDNVHPDWELDCQSHYVFYKVENPEHRIRGLWFHDDAERTRIEQHLGRALATLRNRRSADAAPQAAPPAAAAPPAGAVAVNLASLRVALHALAEDDAFVRAVCENVQRVQAGHSATAAMG